MKISIAKVQPASANDWDTIYQACTYSTYFHSREWGEIWRVYTHGQVHPSPLLVTFSDDRRVLLPLSSQRIYKGLLSGFISSPAGTYGGWISADDLNSEHALALVFYLTKSLPRNLVWRVNPFDPIISQMEIPFQKNDNTYALDLSQGLTAVYKSWSKGHSSAARKARREGIEVRIASTQEDWYAYFQVYEDSIRRWGERASSIYTWQLFEDMWKRRSPHIKLWLAVYQEHVIAGALCFYTQSHVVYWHGAALETFFPLRPVHLVLFECIKNACDRGFSWFDFNPSGGHEGVEAFKRGFGASKLSCPIVIRRTSLSRLIEWGARVLLR